MVITEGEIRSLRSLWARRSARSAAGRLHGPAGAALTGRLQAAQIEYAMIRSGTGALTDPALEAQRRTIRSIRAAIEGAALPGLMPAPAIRWPTHTVPGGGMPVWAAPDPSRSPIAAIPGGVPLMILGRVGEWAQVRNANGWTGWVDGRLLIERR